MFLGFRILPFSHKSVERTEIMVVKTIFNRRLFLLKIWYIFKFLKR
jgi:hypothetical protein